MFNFGGITHIIQSNGKFCLVGSVSTDMMTKRKPTSSDIMGGRVMPDGFAYVGRAYQSIQEIQELAAKCEGVKLCAIPTCACRQLF